MDFIKGTWLGRAPLRFFDVSNIAVKYLAQRFTLLLILLICCVVYIMHLMREVKVAASFIKRSSCHIAKTNSLLVIIPAIPFGNIC